MSNPSTGRSLKYVVAYVACTLVLGLALNAYVATHPLYRGKTARIDRLYAQLNAPPATHCPPDIERTLVIGNSYVDRSFLPEDDCSFVKFTVSGMPLRDASRIVSNLRPEQRIGRVVAGIGYNDANPVESDSSIYMRYWSSTPWARGLWAVPLVRGRGMSLTLVKEDVKCLLGRGACARRQSDPDEDVTVSTEPTELQADRAFQKSIERRWAEYLPYVRSVSSQMRDEIVEIAAACEARGIPLLLYTAPIAPALQKQLDPQFVAAFREQIRSTGVEYVDFNESYNDWGRSYFRDATHVNQTGGHIITAQILTHLEGPAPAAEASAPLATRSTP